MPEIIEKLGTVSFKFFNWCKELSEPHKVLKKLETPSTVPPPGRLRLNHPRRAGTFLFLKISSGEIT